MRRIEEFRQYYNHTIHPELVRMERKRNRLLWLLLSAVLLSGIVLFLQFYLQVLVLSLLLLLPFGLYITYLLYRIQRFRQTFKPNVVNLILDFIDEGINYGTLHYDSKGKIEKKHFMASQIFGSPAPVYQGEDLISGKIGELDFALSELGVKELSRVRNRLNYVFRGVFLRSEIKQPNHGTLLILPRAYKQYLSRSVRKMTLQGGALVEKDLNADFQRVFMTYITPEVVINRLLPEGIQQVLTEYRENSGKEIYVSFVKQELYLAITEPKDLLEPYIFRTNVSFQLVFEFFQDIHLLLSVVEDIDQNN